MRIIEQTQSGHGTLPARHLSPEQLKCATSPLAARILELLATQHEGMHASAIAKELNEPEQKIYYHIRNLKEAGILKLDHLQDTSGGTAKILTLTAPALYTRFRETDPMAPTLAQTETFLEPFITQGSWRAKIVVSSPDPHGPESARGKDAVYAVDLALFLGLFLDTIPSAPMVLDTNLTNWNQNLIIIGGPIVNKAAGKVNEHSLAPYSEKRFISRNTGKEYAQDNVGVIVKIPNPFAKGKWLLLIQGKRFTGTRAAVLAFLEHFDKLKEKTAQNHLSVVLGIDKDSDGEIDTVEFLE